MKSKHSRASVMQTTKATLEDIPQLCQLLNSLFEQEIEFTPDEEAQIRGLKAIMSNSEIGHILVIKKENIVLGMVNLLYTISTALGAKVGILEDMVILKSCRSQGIGSELIVFAIEFAKENGCKRLTLLTDVDNISAHQLYTTKGFCRSSMIPFRMTLNNFTF